MSRFIASVASLLLCCLLLWPSHAQAGVANAPGSNLEVSLVTYGPGDTYWERFGHDAIELRDTVSGEAVTFNYGVFDFDESGFLLNFARGQMHYLMDAAPSDVDQHYYTEVGRSVTRQRLAFTPAQAAEMRDYLLWNLQPENVRYEYDYYVRNCATRVRDAIDKALGGVMKPQLEARAGGMTYRQQTARLMSQQAWLMLILDLGLGPYADQPMNAWQEAFLPMELQSEVRHVTVNNAEGHAQPLVLDEQVVSPNRLDAPPATAPDLRLPLALAGLIFAILLIAAYRFAPVVYALLGSLYLVLAGLVGLALLILWTLTTHHSAWGNANLLLFNPLAFLLLAALWRSRKRLPASRFANSVIALQLLAVLAACLMHLLPGVVQQNQPWLLFALPIWLAMAWMLRKQRAPI
ncbi:lipoprotein N-acyltransferase Lnb domain-containing protein [Dyella japonica]|uniref:lipoprotein N-acyltransferase Lnb domain-containing protein n=1 Tax=Dyella japonica TaxID=231455 RepID=UPI003F513E01